MHSKMSQIDSRWHNCIEGKTLSFANNFFMEEIFYVVPLQYPCHLHPRITPKFKILCICID